MVHISKLTGQNLQAWYKTLHCVHCLELAFSPGTHGTDGCSSETLSSTLGFTVSILDNKTTFIIMYSLQQVFSHRFISVLFVYLYLNYLYISGKLLPFFVSLNFPFLPLLFIHKLLQDVEFYNKKCLKTTFLPIIWEH